MKSLYYRSQKISDRSLIVIAGTTMVVLAVIQVCPYPTSEQKRGQMMEAAYRTEASFDAIACYRAASGHKMLRSQDPARTGMLGPSMSLVTTLPGHLDAKQTSVNPNFAAVVVKYLSDLNAKPGDRVAIGMTGSFPGLNIAVLQACETLELRPVLISSAASSQYGANDPDLLWPDMEKVLHEQDLLSHRSLQTSLGGFRDSAAGMTDDTRELLLASIKNSGVSVLQCDSLSESIDVRMRLIEQQVQGESILAYINVGGGAASVGGTEGNEQFGGGLLLPAELSSMDQAVDCVALRMLQRDVPLLNMVHCVTMARRFGMPIAPRERVQVGQGSVYHFSRYRRGLAAIGILIVLASTAMAVKPPRFLVTRFGVDERDGDESRNPQWMV